MNQPSFLSSSLAVALGGGLGAWLRYVASRATLATIGPIAASVFPWATLFVNVSGSFAMGLLVGWLARHGTGGEGTRLLLGVGVLGGFTTFSAFSLEIVNLAARGSLALAVGYAVISVIVGVTGLILGLALMRVVA